MSKKTFNRIPAQPFLGLIYNVAGIPLIAAELELSVFSIQNWLV